LTEFSAELASDSQADRFPRIRISWRADVTSPENAGVDQAACILTGGLTQDRRWVGTPIDPVTASRHREVTVAVDQAWDNRGPSSIQNLRPFCLLFAMGPDPADASIVEQDVQADLQSGGSPVGQAGITEQNSRAGNKKLTADVGNLGNALG
jgi:hypothetical protein